MDAKPGLKTISERARALPAAVLRGLHRGIEKEGLRVLSDGALAHTPHPRELGSALTHPRITTDFSEAQLELITGVHRDVDACMRELTELHQVVYRAIGEELIWCASMPCKLQSDDDIPIANYGRSNAGRLRRIYREGLSHRYGRKMQAISGIHYNFSLPDETWPALRDAEEGCAAEGYADRRYLGLIRNFRRHSWLLLLLFGSSPAACGSFVANRRHALRVLDNGTVVGPFATSLRMGGLGYQSDAQSAIAVSFNDLGAYARALHAALTTPLAAYEAIGLRDGDDWRQLTTTLLQLENEFYGTIRPKRTMPPGVRPLRALGEHGIEYVEVRCMDVDPFLPVGIDADTMRFLDVFLLHCLLQDSPPDDPAQIQRISRNQRVVAQTGRDPKTRLERAGGSVEIVAWAEELLEQYEPIADALDGTHGGHRYRGVLEEAARRLRAPDSLPSARVLAEMASSHGMSFSEFALARSREHRARLLALPLAARVEAGYRRLAEASWAEQERMEREDELPFDAYRRGYLEQDLLGGAHFSAPGATP